MRNLIMIILKLLLNCLVIYNKNLFSQLKNRSPKVCTVCYVMFCYVMLCYVILRYYNSSECCVFV